MDPQEEAARLQYERALEKLARKILSGNTLMSADGSRIVSLSEILYESDPALLYSVLETEVAREPQDAEQSWARVRLVLTDMVYRYLDGSSFVEDELWQCGEDS